MDCSVLLELEVLPETYRGFEIVSGGSGASGILLKSTDSSSSEGSGLMTGDVADFVLPNLNGTGSDFAAKIELDAAGGSLGVVEGNGPFASSVLAEGTLPKLQPVDVGGGGCGVVLC